MEIILHHSPREGRFVLTDAGGQLVVRIVGSEVHRNGDYRPLDQFGKPPYPMSMGSYVWNWACEPMRTDAGIAAALDYLNQITEEPISKEDVERARRDREVILELATRLSVQEKPLEEMTGPELCDAIQRWMEQLRECPAESVEAALLRVRTQMAARMLRLLLERS